MKKQAPSILPNLPYPFWPKQTVPVTENQPCAAPELQQVNHPDNIFLIKPRGEWNEPVPRTCWDGYNLEERRLEVLYWEAASPAWYYYDSVFFARCSRRFSSEQFCQLIYCTLVSIRLSDVGWSAPFILWSRSLGWLRRRQLQSWLAACRLLGARLTRRVACPPRTWKECWLPLGKEASLSAIFKFVIVCLWTCLCQQDPVRLETLLVESVSEWMQIRGCWKAIIAVSFQQAKRSMPQIKAGRPALPGQGLGGIAANFETWKVNRQSYWVTVGAAVQVVIYGPCEQGRPCQGHAAVRMQNTARRASMKSLAFGAAWTVQFSVQRALAEASGVVSLGRIRWREYFFFEGKSQQERRISSNIFQPVDNQLLSSYVQISSPFHTLKSLVYFGTTCPCLWTRLSPMTLAELINFSMSSAAAWTTSSMAAQIFRTIWALHGTMNYWIFDWNAIELLNLWLECLEMLKSELESHCGGYEQTSRPALSRSVPWDWIWKQFGFVKCLGFAWFLTCFDICLG